MKRTLYLLLTLLLYTTSVKSQIIIHDSVFTTTLDLVGATWNNALIKNCTFKNVILNDGLRIANANNITIDSCVFYNIQGNGIRLHSSGISDGVIIKNCRFDSIYGNGILSAEQHSHTQILNNSFHLIGLDTLSTLQGAPHHGIYFTGNDFLISGNRIRNIYNDNGNCVSVRSNGIVRNNILSDATKNGISYYSDHPNVGNNLLIENNVVYNCQRGVSVVDGGLPYVDTSIIRFNTFITDNLMSVSIGPGLSMYINIYGNVMVRTDASPIYIWATSPFDSAKNVTSVGDIGFVDYLNHDYHITPQSTAYAFATGLLDYPSHDFENDLRASSRLDAGADQIETISGYQPSEQRAISVYPNPAHNEINIILPSPENAHITIKDMLGKSMTMEQGQSKCNISGLPKGVYIICIQQGQSIFYTKFVKQ
jgi:hypothetical protein